MIFRTIEEKDKEQLLQLHHEFHVGFHRMTLLLNSPLKPILQYADPNLSMQKSLEEMYDGSHICFVAEDNEKIVGFISGQINQKDDKLYNKEGYIDDWFIAEQYRSKGIGKELYKSLITEFKKQQCTHLSISAYAENKEALAFYRKLGFHDFTITLKKKLE